MSLFTNTVKLEQLIEQASREQGLVYFGARNLEVVETFPYFKNWLAKGFHAEMNYMENFQDVRKNPERVFPEAKSGFFFGFPYGRPEKFLKRSKPLVAQYARMSDYHRFLKAKIEKVAEAVKSSDFESDAFEDRVFVDTAPLLERGLASKFTNLFIGKNTCLIHAHKGSFYLLGQWITSVSLSNYSKVSDQIDPSKRTVEGGCGSCRRCQVHCPTGALDEDYRLDARKCLSYWTIEHRGEIPERFWKHIGTYVYGCDICQNVCPYNRGSDFDEKNIKKRFDFPDLLDVVRMTQQEYERFFGGSPMTRAKKSGLKRNALIAMHARSHKDLSLAIEYAFQSNDEILKKTATKIKATRSC